MRFDKGIYYIPTQTVLGKSILNPRKVIEKSISVLMKEHMDIMVVKCY